MTVNDINPVLHEVFSVMETDEPDIFVLDIDLTDRDGERYRCKYVSRPEDVFGLNPTVRQWLAENEVETLPYAPPTDEEIRAALPPVTARQLRLTLVRNGLSLANVDAAIAALPEAQAKDEALIEWEYATVFERLSPTLLTIAAALEMSPEQVDTLWTEALAI